MKTIHSFTLLALIPFVHFCAREKDIVKPEKGLVVKTIDGFGKPIKSTIVYESRDCEYDFEKPQTANSNQAGITILKVPAGYLQLYAEGYVYESYKCFTYAGAQDTLTIYAAKIPTYVETGIANAVVTFFSNTSGDCNYESSPLGTTVNADQHGRAVIFLPQGDTYKIQVNGEVQCFQPDQEVHTIRF